MWNVAHSSRFASIQCDGPREDVGPVVVEAEDEAAVHLDAVVVQDRAPAGRSPSVRGVFLPASTRFSSASDSKPTNTPVQPASAISRTSDGSSVTSIVTAALQIFSSGRSAGRAGAGTRGREPRLLSMKTRVGLPVGAELGDDLLDVAHVVGHAQPIGGQVAEAAAVVAAARGDQAGRGQKAPPRQQVAARRRVVAIGRR